MSPLKKQNVGHSIIEQLHHCAKKNNEDFSFLLFRYGVERFLYRLSMSPYANKFVLKGAHLFLLWKGHNYRVTKDADLLGFGSPDPNHVAGIFREICQAVPSDIDGVEFKSDSVRSVPIRENQEYEGIRVTLVGVLHHARIHLQIDIGFGDAITPDPEKMVFPTLLSLPAPHVLAYPRYTVVSEKFEAMIRLGIANSRMKDFYDIWLLSTLFGFDGDVLGEAIHNTFHRRSTPLPLGLPMAFTEEFRRDTQKQTQWRAFVRKSKPESVPESLDVTIAQVRAFVMPVLDAVREQTRSGLVWPTSGPWHTKDT